MDKPLPLPLHPSDTVTTRSVLPNPMHEQPMTTLANHVNGEDEDGKDEGGIHSCRHCAIPVIEPPGSPDSPWHLQQKYNMGTFDSVYTVVLTLCNDPLAAFEAAQDGCLLFQTLLVGYRKEDIGSRPDFRTLVLKLRARIDPFRIDHRIGIEAHWQREASLQHTAVHARFSIFSHFGRIS